MGWLPRSFGTAGKSALVQRRKRSGSFMMYHGMAGIQWRRPRFRRQSSGRRDDRPGIDRWQQLLAVPDAITSIGKRERAPCRSNSMTPSITQLQGLPHKALPMQIQCHHHLPDLDHRNPPPRLQPLDLGTLRGPPGSTGASTFSCRRLRGAGRRSSRSALRSYEDGCDRRR